MLLDKDIGGIAGENITHQAASDPGENPYENKQIAIEDGRPIICDAKTCFSENSKPHGIHEKQGSFIDTGITRQPSPDDRKENDDGRHDRKEW